MSPRTQNTPLTPAEHSVPFRAQKTRAGAEGGSGKRHPYKPLPPEFRRNEFSYRQIARDGNVAIYEQCWTGCSDGSVPYEVVRIRRREGFEIHGRFVKPAEMYPASEAWGVDGFTLTKKDAAFRKFREVAGRKAVQ